MEKLSKKYEGKNKEDAIKKGLKDLNKEEHEVLIKELENETGLFKTKKEAIVMVSKETIVDYIKTFIKKLGQLMKIDMVAEVTSDEEVYNVSLITAKNPIVIGKDGKNLDAIQLILRQTLSRLTDMNIKIVVDASNYKEKRSKNFEYEIKSIAKGVLYSKTEASLDPMNSYERRVVHTIIAEFANLISASEGEEPNRRIVIKYKED